MMDHMKYMSEIINMIAFGMSLLLNICFYASDISMKLMRLCPMGLVVWSVHPS